MRYSIEGAALTCFLANRGLRIAQADPASDDPWEGATAEERASYIHGVDYAMGRATDAETQHAEWFRWHLDRGWVWGPEYDEQAKVHPAMVLNWSEVPEIYRDRGRLFLRLVAWFAAAL